MDHYFSEGLTGSSDRSFVGGLARESAVSMQGHQIANRSLGRSTDRESQDKNFVGLLDQFAKTAGSRDSFKAILTHVYPYRLCNKW